MEPLCTNWAREVTGHQAHVFQDHRFFNSPASHQPCRCCQSNRSYVHKEKYSVHTLAFYIRYYIHTIIYLTQNGRLFLLILSKRHSNCHAMKTWSYQGVPTKILSPKVILKSCYVLMHSSFKVVTRNGKGILWGGAAKRKEPWAHDSPWQRYRGGTLRWSLSCCFMKGNKKKTAEQKA